MSEPDASPPASERGPDEAPEAEALARRLVEVAGGTVEGVLLYGSHLLRTSPDRHSAVDLVVIVEEYRPFYEALARASELHRPVGVMTALARALPPNVHAFAPDDGRLGIAKYLLVSRADFERALGPEPPDHFILGRMVQRVGVLWTRDADAEGRIAAGIGAARARVLDWMAPYLTGPVDAEGLGRRLLEVCYQGELRPESTARAGRIFDAQAEHFAATLGPVLEAASTDGRMVPEGRRYVLARPAAASERRRWRRHFRRSKVRATLRWLKHTFTFVNWLPYIVHKVERHSGRRIELTRLERKLPLIFLWPRVVHVLLTRPRREIES